MGPLGSVNCALEALQVGHHGSHHASREAAADKEGGHLRIGRVYPVSEEIVDEFLGKAPDFHVSVHIQVLDRKTVRAHHFADRDDIRMYLPPGQGFHGDVKIVGSRTGDFQHGSR